MHAGSITSNAAIQTTATRMTWLAVDADMIPLMLRGTPRWAVWRAASRDIKVTNTPYRGNAPSQNASSTDPHSWTDFAAAMNTYAQAKAERRAVR